MLMLMLIVFLKSLEVRNKRSQQLTKEFDELSSADLHIFISVHQFDEFCNLAFLHLLIDPCLLLYSFDGFSDFRRIDKTISINIDRVECFVKFID